MHKTFLRITTVGAMGALLAACAGGGDLTPPPNSGTFKIGVPYEVGGDWYYPKEEPDYDETGVASWYGPTFYGHRTADGEVFDATAMTAAHRTLPMPVNVRVTNLDNGRTAVLRVNDRGPFARGRIIDVSEHAAEVLGFKNQGTAHVRVQYLARADGNAPAPNFDDNNITPQSRTPMAPVASAREPGGSSIASAPVGVVQAAALGATTVMTSAGPVMMQHVPPPDPIPAAPIPSFSTPASSGNGQPTQSADSSKGPASAGIASNDLPPLPASGQGSLTGSDLADSTGHRSDLTPMGGGDPNAPAPPPLIDHSDDPGAGNEPKSHGPLSRAGSGPAQAARSRLPPRVDRLDHPDERDAAVLEPRGLREPVAAIERLARQGGRQLQPLEALGRGGGFAPI